MANTFKNTVLTVTDLTVALVNTGNHIVSNISFSLRKASYLGIFSNDLWGLAKVIHSFYLIFYKKK